MLIFCFILLLGGNKVPTSAIWTKTLTNHVTEILKPHQVIFLVDEEIKKGIQESRIEEMVERINGIVPTWKLSFNNLSVEYRKSLNFMSSLQSPRETSLFIIVQFSRDNYSLRQLEVPIEFMISTSSIRSRPKTLMVLSTRNNSLSFQRLLRFMWSKKFLDATVLEIFKTCNSDFDSCEDIKVQYFNPFTKIFSRKAYSSKVQIFPDKLKNMYGHELKVAVLEKPPFSYVKRNTTGHPVETRGADIFMSEIISRKMNFKMFMTPSKTNSWGQTACNKDRMTGIRYNISNSDIQYVSSMIGNVDSCKEKFMESTYNYDFIDFVALVPTLRNTAVLYLDLWKCALPVIIICLITCIVQIFGHKLNFEAPLQKWNDILRPLLGTSVDESPRKLKERIVFSCLLIIGMTYLSFIFSSLTDATIKVDSEQKMDDLYDLHQSGIKPLIYEQVYNVFFNSSEGVFRQLLQKAIINSSFSDRKCLDILIAHKNISCFMRRATFKTFLVNSRKIDGMQVLKQPLITSPSGMRMEPASPYVDRFNEIIGLVVQSGLYAKWKNDFLINEDIKFQDQARRVLHSQGISSQILFFMITGYTLAFVAFLAELVQGNWNSLKELWNRY